LEQKLATEMSSRMGLQIRRKMGAKLMEVKLNVRRRLLQNCALVSAEPECFKAGAQVEIFMGFSLDISDFSENQVNSIRAKNGSNLNYDHCQTGEHNNSNSKLSAAAYDPVNAHLWRPGTLLEEPDLMAGFCKVRVDTYGLPPLPSLCPTPWLVSRAASSTPCKLGSSEDVSKFDGANVNSGNGFVSNANSDDQYIVFMGLVILARNGPIQEPHFYSDSESDAESLSTTVQKPRRRHITDFSRSRGYSQLELEQRFRSFLKAEFHAIVEGTTTNGGRIFHRTNYSDPLEELVSLKPLSSSSRKLSGSANRDEDSETRKNDSSKRRKLVDARTNLATESDRSDWAREQEAIRKKYVP